MHTSIIETLLKEKIDTYDIVVRNLSVHKEAALGEVIRHRVRAEKTAILSPDDLRTNTDSPSEPVVVESKGQWLYPDLKRFASSRKDEGDVESIVDDIALDLVRQKEKFFFNMLRMSARASGTYIKHAMPNNADASWGCDQCGIMPIALLRSKGVRDAVYINTSALQQMLATKEIRTWFDPVTRFDIMETGYIGHVLGMAIFSDVFREHRDDIGMDDFADQLRKLFSEEETVTFPTKLTHPLRKLTNQAIPTMLHVGCVTQGIRHTLPFKSVKINRSMGTLVGEHCVAFAVMGEVATIIEHVPER